MGFSFLFFHPLAFQFITFYTFVIIVSVIGVSVLGFFQQNRIHSISQLVYIFHDTAIILIF